MTGHTLRIITVLANLTEPILTILIVHTLTIHTKFTKLSVHFITIHTVRPPVIHAVHIVIKHRVHTPAILTVHILSIPKVRKSTPPNLLIPTILTVVTHARQTVFTAHILK